LRKADILWSVRRKRHLEFAGAFATRGKGRDMKKGGDVIERERHALRKK